jgi:phosphatidylcholine synthase
MSGSSPPDIMSLPEARAFLVPVFTASGVALGFAAMMAAAAQRWTLMFCLLAAALFIDGIDGAIARRLRVTELAPRWSGDVLDLVVDFVTYVFVPAYAIATAGLLPESLAIPAGMVIVVTSALYFADREMKTSDYYFRGFPGLWNAVAFYLFVLKPAPWLAAAAVTAFAVLTFVPFKFVHPFRVVRLRALTVAALVLWAALGAYALGQNLDLAPWAAWSLVGLGLYFVMLGPIDQWMSNARPSA